MCVFCTMIMCFSVVVWFDILVCFVFYFFCFKQKTAYEWRISDWSSDLCSSDLTAVTRQVDRARLEARCVGRIDIDRVGELIGGADAVREVAVVRLAAFDRVRDVEERRQELKIA